jgi:hypothetical protein
MGHYNIIDSMLRTCDKVIIAVGSAQEYGTERNPFSYGLRASMIFKSFSWACNRLMIVPVRDREHPSNDPSWGDYLLNNVKTYTGLTPDVIYEGEEAERSNWYDNYDIPVVRIERSQIIISSTDIRKAFLDDDKEFVMTKTPCAIWLNYDNLREELLKCYN